MESLQTLSDEEVTSRYCRETIRLKAALLAKKQGVKPLRYPNTTLMNRCRSELVRRGLPVPRLSLPESEQVEEATRAAITEQEYMLEVMRTYAGSDTTIDKLTLSALGLAGESGEVADAIKRVLYQGHHLDLMSLVGELGDILWYLILACDALDCTLEDVMQVNVAKLRERYPHGFDSQRSINRPL